VALLLATLLVRALIPAGYMVGSKSMLLTVELCESSDPGSRATQVAIPIDRTDDGPTGQHGMNDGACAFSALSFAAVSGADPALLAIALIFIVTLGFAPMASVTVRRALHLRPPLRGPPAA